MSGGRVLLTGGTGLIGRRLRQRLEGRPLRLPSRHPEKVRCAAHEEACGWDGRHVAPELVAGCDAVVHLAGEPLFGLPTPGRLERVRASRIESTRSLVAAIGALSASERPRSFVCASAIGYYGDGGEAELDESAPAGDGMIPRLCRDWEAEAARAREHGVRVVSLRTGVVLAREGGALALMRPAFRLGLGGPLGSGRQWFAWIHLDDEAALLAHALGDASLEGPVNGVAPEPVRNEALTRALAQRLGRPAFLRVPAFALRAALGPLAGELLDSRRLRPARAEASGFAFAYPRLEDALGAELGPGA